MGAPILFEKPFRHGGEVGQLAAKGATRDRHEALA